MGRSLEIILLREVRDLALRCDRAVTAHDIRCEVLVDHGVHVLHAFQH